MILSFFTLISLTFAATATECDRTDKVCAEPDAGETNIQISDLSGTKYCNCDFRKKGYTLTLASSVTRIPEYAFYKTKLSSFSMPYVERIDDYAFYRCDINSISFGNDPKLTRVGRYSFQMAKISYDIVLPKSLTTVNDHAFDKGSGERYSIDLSQVTSLTTIGSYAFNMQIVNFKPESLPFPTSITRIEDYAFNDIVDSNNIPVSLTINFDEYKSLVYIGAYAFNNANIQATLYIRSNTQAIGSHALYNPSSTQTITVYIDSTDSLVEIGNDAFNKPTVYLNKDFKNTITFTDKMKTIGSNAFQYQNPYFSDRVIKKVVFAANSDYDLIGDNAFNDRDDLIFEGPITAHRIGKNAFQGCSLLNSPIKITARANQGGSIGDSAFVGCTNLINSLTIDPPTENEYTSYPSIGASAFENVGVTTLDLPHMEIIKTKAFSGCEKLTGSSNKDLIVDTINPNAFYLDYLVNFRNIISNDIQANAFTGCISLAPSKIQIIPKKYVGGSVKKEAFLNCKALASTLEIVEPEEPKYPDDEKKYTTISDSAFKNSGIASLDFKCIIEKIDKHAFENCLSLTQSVSKAINAKTIDESAFDGDKNLVLSTITANVICTKAFRHCYNLGANIEINDKSENAEELIGENAFEDCYSLGTLHFNISYINEQNEPEERTIGSQAFLNSGLTGPLTIPNTIKTISSEAFSFCSKIGKVTFESNYINGLTISDSAFYHSGVNQELIIPNTVTSVGNLAFAYTLITSLTIQGSIILNANNNIISTVVNDQAFYYCTGLTSLTFGDGEINIEPDDKKNEAIKTFRGCNLRTVNLGSIKTIPVEIFYGMTNLNFPNTIPDTLTEIKDRVFSQCTGLTNFKFTSHSQLKTIGENAFYKCSSLNSFEFPFEVDTVEQYTFYQCTGLNSVKFNNKIKDIGQYAFYGCSNLKGPLTLPDKLETIGSCAFQNCYSLDQSLTIPDSVTTINERAFMDCHSFTNDLTFGRSISTIGDYAFRDCSGFNGKLSFPDYFYNKAALQLGEGAFYGCTGFTGDLTIPQKTDTEDDLTVLIPNLGNYVFRGCSGFNGNLNLPNTVTEIPEGAFYGCTNLCGDISLMKLTSVSKYAFYGCSHISGSVNLEDIGSSSRSSSATINEYAFYGCNGLNGSLILPADCTIEVKEHAFDGCSHLKGTLDGSLFSNIKKYAFAKCSSLTGQLDFGEDTKEIQEYAFLDCSGFSDQLSFIINDVKDNGLTIGHCAFKGCKGFKNGRLTFNINANEEKEFSLSDRLSSYYRYDYFLKIGNDAFDGTKFKNVYYMGRFEPDCDYDIGISSIKGIHTSSNYANKTFCGNPIRKSKLSGGAIAGIVIACIVVVAVIVFLIVFFILKNKKNKDQSEAEVEMNQDP